MSEEEFKNVRKSNVLTNLDIQLIENNVLQYCTVYYDKNNDLKMTCTAERSKVRNDILAKEEIMLGIIKQNKRDKLKLEEEAAVLRGKLDKRKNAWVSAVNSGFTETANTIQKNINLLQDQITALQSESNLITIDNIEAYNILDFLAKESTR